MGFYQHKGVGRPTPDAERVWVNRCNFVIKVVATTTMLDNSSSGWMVRVETPQESARILVSCDTAASTSLLRKKLMKTFRGLIARITTEDFFELVEHDASKEELDNVHISENAGLVRVEDTTLWVFPNLVLDSKGKSLANPPIMMSDAFPFTVYPSHRASMSHSHLTNLGRCTIDFFGERGVHALHVYSCALKAILKDQIMEAEHMLPITNVSGPPNVGKTFACSIALRMMLASEQLMLSRATPSSLLDICDHHNNMLVVWDDPRDATDKQLCTIVHEAFHGFPNTTVSKGLRKYNSGIIIGTQRHLLGLPELAEHTPTFSRLAHIDMNLANSSPQNDETHHAAEDLAAQMKHLEGIFPLLVKSQYDKKLTNKYHAKLTKFCGDQILERSVRVAAIEWNMCSTLNDIGLGFREKDIESYFCDWYVSILRKHCNRISPLQQFIQDCKANLENIPSNILKTNMYADLKHSGSSKCVAMHLRSVMSCLKTLCDDTNYTLESVQAEIKSNKDYGEIGHNVNYREGSCNIIRRSVVIRKHIWDTLI